MLPVEKAKGQVYLGEDFLCDVEHEVSEPLQASTKPHIQRLILEVPDEHCAALLDAYDLSLILADGHQYHIPRPIRNTGHAHLECYVETY